MRFTPFTTTTSNGRLLRRVAVVLVACGDCHEPGEYCSGADHGISGVAGDGEPIVCENKDGWRWEPK